MNKLTKTPVTVGKSTLFVNDVTQHFRVGTKGKGAPIAYFFGSLPKGEARKIRKTLNRNGFTNAAGAGRLTPLN